MGCMISERGIVQGLEKGLDLLAFLNRYGRLSAAEIARGIGLPRTTTLRLLDTLAANGFIERSKVDRCYQLTIKVRTLSDGFDDEAWVTDIAARHVRALSTAVVWPVLISIPSGTSMIWRENTDHQTTMVLHRLSVGYQTSIIGSASGQIYLAFASDQEREAVLEWIARTEEGARELPSPSALTEMVERIRACGYTIFRRPGEYTLAVPIRHEGRYLASLAIRVMAAAMSVNDMIARYRDRLFETAAEIEADVQSSIKPTLHAS